jgi:alpha-D-xyloside xylohydrolase
MHTVITKLKAMINLHDGEVAIKNAEGETLLREGTGQITPSVIINEKVNNIKQSFNWANDEALYGLGQHQEGIFNWRGHYAELFQYNMRAIVPFLFATKGYCILWENY